MYRISNDEAGIQKEKQRVMLSVWRPRVSAQVVDLGSRSASLFTAPSEYFTIGSSCCDVDKSYVEGISLGESFQNAWQAPLSAKCPFSSVTIGAQLLEFFIFFTIIIIGYDDKRVGMIPLIHILVILVELKQLPSTLNKMKNLTRIISVPKSTAEI